MSTLKTQVGNLSAEVTQYKNQPPRVVTRYIQIPESGPSPSTAMPAPPPDPDGIYQLGVKTGTVSGATEDLADGKIFFQEAFVSSTFDIHSNFQYRNYVLSYVNEAGASDFTMPGQVGGATLNQVVCKIVSVTQSTPQ